MGSFCPASTGEIPPLLVMVTVSLEAQPLLLVIVHTRSALPDVLPESVTVELGFVVLSTLIPADPPVHNPDSFVPGAFADKVPVEAPGQ